MYDCRQYSDDELSLVIFNDESLYRQRYSLTKSVLREYGIKFTQEQWETFQDDLNSEDE